MAKNPFAEARRQRPYELASLADPAGAWAAAPEGARVAWLGHASALVEIDGVVLLIDPVFGKVGGLLPRAAPAPWSVEQLPGIDAVLVSHGHMDHLDAASLDALARRFGPDLPFLVPLGQGRSLPRAARRVVELDWWQHVTIRGVEVHLVPAQHWHRRGPFDLNRALWGGFVVRGSRSLYHSGDTGWFDGFAAIGEVFGGVDAALLPLGAYEPRWFMSDQHMAPEDSVRAFELTRARCLLGMHWGTFDLTDEPLDHGPRELLPAILEERGHDPERFFVMRHGGVLSFGEGAWAEGRL